MTDAALNLHIATIPKSTREDLRLTLTEWKGVQFLNIRVHAGKNADSERRPTKAGITVRFHRLAELRDAIAKAEAKAPELGLIGGDE